MTVLEALENLGRNGDDEASELYLQAMDFDEKQLSQWVAENDETLRRVLDLELLSTIADEDKDIGSLMSDYAKTLNAGRSAFNTDSKVGPSGEKLPTLQDYMASAGVYGSDDGAYTRKDLSKFTDPESPTYWGKMSANDKAIAAMDMGYGGDVEAWERDVERSANKQQIENKYEGYDPSGDVDLINWAGSALLGLGAPRIKEALVSGRDWTWQDLTGDLTELGLNIVPGVGIFNKAGRLVAKVPKVGWIGQGLGIAADQAVVPFATQALDSKILYNPDVLGTETSAVNPRNEFDWVRAGTQMGGIVAAKGAIKGGAMVGKNALEQGMGNKFGGKAFRQAVDTFESIGEKTEDIIARRQAALDRKAMLQQSKNYVPKGGRLTDESIATGQVNHPGAVPDDIINAENYAILTNEARELAKTRNARKYLDKVNAYGTILRQADENTKFVSKLDDGRFIFTDRPVGDVPYTMPNSEQVPIEAIRDFSDNRIKKYVYKDESQFFDKMDDAQKRLARGSQYFDNVRDVAANVGFNAASRQGLVGNIGALNDKRDRALWNKMMMAMRPLTANSKLSPEERKANSQAVLDVMQYGLDGVPVELFERNPRVYKLIAKQLGIANWRHPSEPDDGPQPTTSYSSAE